MPRHDDHRRALGPVSPGHRSVWFAVALMIVALLTALAAFTAAGATTALAADEGPAGVEGRSWILVDAGSGKVLAAHNEHEPQLSASTVKVMTALTALRFLSLDSTVTVSDLAAERPPMRLGMESGEKWKTRDAMYAMLMESANDAAYAIAEQARGDLKSFAKEMNAFGRSLGLQDSTFADPAGFDGQDTAIGPSKVSAYDLAIIGRAALNSPTVSKIVGTVSRTITGPDGTKHSLVNHNRALNSGTDRYYAGTIGIKTGFTSAAQGTFVTAARQNGRTLIAVVMGNKDIYTPTQLLFQWGFSGAAGVTQAAAASPTTVPATAAPATGAPATSAAKPAPTKPAPAKPAPTTAATQPEPATTPAPAPASAAPEPVTTLAPAATEPATSAAPSTQVDAALLATTTVPVAAAAPEADPEVLAALARDRSHDDRPGRDYGGLIGGSVAAMVIAGTGWYVTRSQWTRRLRQSRALSRLNGLTAK
ncbi:MAG: D-alanyl-D-alanine carboxypeptidase family protein [Acidimicrobiia bacterium]